MERWFLLDDRPSSGAFNMACDELLLARAERGSTPPVLRLYSFGNPTITFGFHQRPERIIDIDAARRASIDIVRRYTGGRALLHEGELTYSVAARSGDGPFGEHLQRTYLRISGALAEALRELGVEASVSAGKAGAGDRGLARPCLGSVSRHEITVGGRKIVASAQRRTNRSLLQHGSILLDGSSARIVDYLKGEWGPIGDRITSVREEAGRNVSRAEMKEAVIEAFERVFGMSLDRLPITPAFSEELERRAASKREESRLLFAREVCA
jgi:lipoate-protein ligase A